MRYVASLIVLLAIFLVGCSEVKKEIDTPGPAPPFNPKDAQLPANLQPKQTQEPENPADSPADAPADVSEDSSAEESK